MRRVIGPKTRKMCAERIDAAALSAAMLSAALQSSGVSVAALALALGVSRQHAERWVKEGDECSLTIRDLLAARRQLPTLYAEVVRQLVGEETDAPPSRLPHATHALLVAAEAGDVARVMVCAATPRQKKRRELRQVIDAAERALADLDAEDRAMGAEQRATEA